MHFDEVLEFWFGTLDTSGHADAAHTQRWWKKDSAFDDELRHRFAALHEGVANGQLDTWLPLARGRLAYVIVLNQFSRNMFRGTPRMFAYDPLALRTAGDGIARGFDKSLVHDERDFLYMPFMHSENLADQDRSVALFASVENEAPTPEGNFAFAKRHRDIIQRFGRFPHRNALLGRISTPEELEFLKQPNSSF